jgi:hypothetical protein
MNMYNPYIQQMQQTQDLGGLNPVFQNIANQQAMQQQALQQGMDLTNQAGMTVDGKQAGMNPMMMAQMLRKENTGSPYLASLPAMMKYGSGNVYGGFGQGQTPTQANWDLDAQGM